MAKAIAITATEAATLTAIEAKAMSKAKGTGKIEAGDHPFNFTVQVQGVLRKGDNYEATPTASIPMIQAFALFVKRMGFQREAALAKLQEAMQEAFAAGVNGEKIDLGDLSEAEDKVRAMIGTLPKTICEGKTTFPEINITKVS
jgi:hypothetical protein